MSLYKVTQQLLCDVPFISMTALVQSASYVTYKSVKTNSVQLLSTSANWTNNEKSLQILNNLIVYVKRLLCSIETFIIGNYAHIILNISL